MSTIAPLLKLVGVSKRYPAPNGAELAVLDQVSLEIGRGESLAVVGPSGSGKSTLLQIMGTLDHPSEGKVLLEGQELNAMDERQLAAVRNHRLGFVFQAHYLLPQCTVLENVLVPTLANSSPPAEPKTEPVETRATRLLQRVGLGDRILHRPGQLSGGERQRVAVVRALINRPLLLLADEPTGALDHASAQQLGQLLVELNQEENVTLVVVTHSTELASRMISIMELKDGRLIPAS